MVSMYSIESSDGFNSKCDCTRDNNAQDRQPELNLLIGNGKHTRRKGLENILSKKEGERERNGNKGICGP